MEDFDYAVSETIRNLALVGAAAYFEPLVDQVEVLKNQYGKTLRATFIGRDNAAPVFGNRTETWAELSESWRRRKNPKGDMSNRFYKGMSKPHDSLASALFNLPGERLFGKTTLRTRLEQVETDGWYNPRIKRQIKTVFRDDRGRFAVANAQARKNVRVIVNPFPNVSYRDSESIIRALPIDTKNKRKLSYNDGKRPLMEPYTEWFVETKVRAAILNMVKRMG